jgi:hypothetical protein
LHISRSKQSERNPNCLSSDRVKRGAFTANEFKGGILSHNLSFYTVFFRPPHKNNLFDNNKKTQHRSDDKNHFSPQPYHITQKRFEAKANPATKLQPKKKAKRDSPS